MFMIISLSTYINYYSKREAVVAVIV